MPLDAPVIRNVIYMRLCSWAGKIPDFSDPALTDRSPGAMLEVKHLAA
jgi:hypothetical protein